MRPISIARLARAEPHAVAALHAGLRSGVGAALVKHRRAHALILARLRRASAEFFLEPTAAKAAASNHSSCPAFGPMPVLVGWRRPSDSKELYRSFAGESLPASTPGRLRTLACAAQRLLHHALVVCLRTILRAAGARCSARAVRELLVGTQKGAQRLNCALDLFYYPNDAAAVSPNCTPHVDRGYLSAIVVSDVPGLVLLDGAARRLVSPCQIWPRARPHEHTVVLVNHALQALDATGWSNTSPVVPTNNEPPPLMACTHAVTKASAPRLSISYELRPAFGTGADDPVEWVIRNGRAKG
tara:strand:+ start:556 stop:1455 length:900 start_codon:yes stop_codon:yes gene_type:complete